MTEFGIGLCECNYLSVSWIKTGFRLSLFSKMVIGYPASGSHRHLIRADSRLAPSYWERSLQSNAVSHWLGANLESALLMVNAHWMTVTTVHAVLHIKHFWWCFSVTTFTFNLHTLQDRCLECTQRHSTTETINVCVVIDYTIYNIGCTHYNICII